MAMTNAERQAAYRQRAKQSRTEGRQVNAVVSATAAGALKRLARWHGLTQAVMLDRLLRAAENDVLDGRRETWPGIEVYTPEYERYWHGVSNHPPAKPGAFIL